MLRHRGQLSRLLTPRRGPAFAIGLDQRVDPNDIASLAQKMDDRILRASP